MYHIQIGINISSEAKTDFIVNELIPFLEEHVKDNYYFTRSVNVIPVIDLYLNTSDIKITYIYSKIQSIFDKYLSNLSEASVQENKYYLDNQKNISRVNGYSASVTEAEALNRFIVKSKDIIDMNFEYEFMNDGNINRVITRVKDKEVIEAEGKNELLLDAAKESVAETIIKLFQSYGVKVSLALGFDEIKRLFASEKSVYAFDDKGIFSKEGVLIFRVD